MPWAALATLGAGIINSAGSVYTNNNNVQAQLQANAQNVGAQLAINDAQLQASALNNQTAINLANTAHQREVQDLRDAGLNPILSANGNGADVPTLSTPNLESPQVQAATIENPMGGIASALTALQANNDRHAIDKLRAEILGGAVPTQGLEQLRIQSQAESQSAVSQARVDQARNEYEEQLWNVRKEALDAGLNELHFDRGAFRQMARPIERKMPNLRNLIWEGVDADIRDKSNINWRNNVNSMGSAVNGASTLFEMVRPQPFKFRHYK